MARAQTQSDRDFSANGRNPDEHDTAAHLMQDSEVAELFDDAARRRFGEWISKARLRADAGKRRG
jgi:hypothetical protein